MRQLKDYVRTYDGVVTPSMAKELIKLYENNVDLHEKYDQNARPQFTQLNFTQLYQSDRGEYADLHGKLQKIFLNYIDVYKTEMNIDWQFQNDIALEEFRIKKYNPSKLSEDPCEKCVQPKSPDQFKEHVDVLDYNSSRRYLAFFLYLNDPSAGETVFPRWHQHIKPQTGKLLIFPPTWQYPHIGKPCKVKPKYIVGSYLHYL